MAKTTKRWKKGRGKLGLFAPLLGSWRAETTSPMGALTCERIFSETLGGKYIQLTADWKFGKGSYQELALFGIDENGEIVFWSFTSDGKRSSGALTDVTDLHPQAIGFEAHMPAGIARMAYWPDEEDGFH